MDYLGLQQRANQIVSKVNNYEAGLAKYEITEADILAEHKYADLYTPSCNEFIIWIYC